MNRFFSTQWLELPLSIWRVQVVRRITSIVCTVQPVHVTAPSSRDSFVANNSLGWAGDSCLPPPANPRGERRTASTTSSVVNTGHAVLWSEISAAAAEGVARNDSQAGGSCGCFRKNWSHIVVSVSRITIDYKTHAAFPCAPFLLMHWRDVRCVWFGSECEDWASSVAAVSAAILFLCVSVSPAHLVPSYCVSLLKVVCGHEGQSDWRVGYAQRR